MATATLKCVECKDRFPRAQMKPLAPGNFCTLSCIASYGLKKAKKDNIKKIAKIYGADRKPKINKDDLRTRKRAAKDACHLYIRTRDKGDNCICCNKPLTSNYQAGHYLESGNNPKIRYDEDNIHAQNLNCNYFKGGDSGLYIVNLINKIGLERVLRLESMKGGVVKRTADGYKTIENHYKNKLKLINGDL